MRVMNDWPLSLSFSNTTDIIVGFVWPKEDPKGIDNKNFVYWKFCVYQKGSVKRLVSVFKVR